MSSGRARIITVALAAAWLITCAASALMPGDFAHWNHRIHDLFFHVRRAAEQSPPVDPDLVFIDVDDSSYEAMGNAWYTRRSYARLLRVLHEVGVRAAVFDVVFVGPIHQEPDVTLPEAAHEFGRAYFPLIVTIDPPGEVPASARAARVSDIPAAFEPASVRWGTVRSVRGVVQHIEALDAAAAGMGHITTYPDRDGVYRRKRLVVRNGDRVIPSLALAVAMDLLGVEGSEVVLNAGVALHLGDLRAIPIDDEGRTVVNFAGRWGENYPHFSAHRILEAEGDEALLDQLAEALEDAVVVIADVSTRSQDFGTSALEKIYPKVGLHMAMLNGILTSSFVREKGRATAYLLALGASGLMWVLALRLGAAWFATASAAIMASALGGPLATFVYGDMLVPVVEPALCVLLGAAAVLGLRFFWAERDRALLRSSFESYLPGPVLDKVLRSPDLLSGVSRKRLTVLFSDIAGFTRWCSTQSPSTIRLTLNSYFQEMTRIVFDHGGTVDKYIGDGLMVFFGDPVEQPDHARRAVLCAIEMQRCARELAKKWRDQVGLDLKIRVGINTGEVAVGKMGSERRVDYTVLGSEVNMSQRLESNAPQGSVLISRSTYEELKNTVPCHFHDDITVKGYDNAVSTYEVDWSALGDPEPGQQV